MGVSDSLSRNERRKEWERKGKDASEPQGWCEGQVEDGEQEEDASGRRSLEREEAGAGE